MDDGVMLHLPMDIIDKILSHIPDPASLACLASTCKFWCNLIKDPSSLESLRRRRHSHGFTPSLLLGFFYQDSTESESPPQLWQKDKWRCLAPRVSVESSTSMSPSLRKMASWPSVTAQKALMARTSCVCKPLTGEIFHIPSIPFASPHMYALLVTEDVILDVWTSQSFQLVAIWFRERRFIIGSYCSKTKRWIWLGQSPDLMPDLYLVQSPAAPCGGAIHFLCGSSTNWTLTHVAKLHVATQKLSYLELPFDVKRSKGPLLANSADGGLLLLKVKGLQMSLWKHGMNTSSWVLSEIIDLASSLPLRVVQMQARAKIKLEMFLGRSGAVVLWVEGEGLFLFSLSNGLMRKINNERATKKYGFCPYEIDWLSCLAVTNLVVDGTMLRDAGRTKIQGRWRKLMARHMKKDKKAS